ncbi:AMP-binding protein [Flavobacterium sp. SM15]|uniref:AMP-binding protein n=1 Tax=Flavobacterium sp. SM15 TaxID=2908005 RepID=UPI001EDAF6B6|nr:AMP-binding protein [Flavobacterium sp. SM15]MCG2611477.1 AMP-binding protein [Flavobacterium sp. SM15]
MNINEIHPQFQLNGSHYTIEELRDFASKLISYSDEHEQHLGKFILEWFDDSDSITLRTSGTTGKPKNIELKKVAMLESAKATGAFFDVHEGSRALHCLPVQYIAGKMMLVRALALGWELDYVRPTSNPLDFNDTIYDFVAMVPFQVENSLEKLSNVKKIIIGGAKLNPLLAEKLKNSDTEVFETYGMTETITHIAAKNIKEKAFSALPGVTFSIDNRNCLTIKAPRVCSEELITNDVVELTDNEHFVWLGRFDNVVNSGGIKLFPEQIEEKLAGKIMNRFFVTGKADAALGEKLVLVIESESFNLDHSVFEHLNKYEKPKEIIFVSKFIETETGKIKRAESIA